MYWCNFTLPNDIAERSMTGVMCGQSNDELKKLCEFHKIDVSTYKGEQSKTKIARNLVDYEVGKTIFETAIGIIQKSNTKQLDIFAQC